MATMHELHNFLWAKKLKIWSQKGFSSQVIYKVADLLFTAIYYVAISDLSEV